jgi:hypothetical protein
MLAAAHARLRDCGSAARAATVTTRLRVPGSLPLSSDNKTHEETLCRQSCVFASAGTPVLSPLAAFLVERQPRRRCAHSTRRYCLIVLARVDPNSLCMLSRLLVCCRSRCTHSQLLQLFQSTPGVSGHRNTEPREVCCCSLLALRRINLISPWEVSRRWVFCLTRRPRPPFRSPASTPLIRDAARIIRRLMGANRNSRIPRGTQHVLKAFSGCHALIITTFTALLAA